MKSIIAVALLLVAALAISAQEQQIEKAVFEQALSGTTDHSVKWKEKTYRMTVTSTLRMANRPETDYDSTMLFEYGPNGSSHSTHQAMFGGKPTKSLGEVLVIGDTVYRHSENGPWTQSPKTATENKPKTGADPNPSDASALDTSETTYFSLGLQPFKGETAAVYKKVVKKTELLKELGEVSDGIITTTYWLVGGLQRKSEIHSVYKRPSASTNNLISVTWDLDPTITFKVPEVVK